MKKPPLYPVYPITDLRDFLIQVADRYSSRVALRSKKDGTYNSVTYSQLGERVTELATAFSEFGLQKGDRVAMLSENRTEWAVAYLAAVAAGLVAVPIDRDLTVPEICHVLNFSKPRVLVCSKQYVDQLKECRSDIPSLEQLISMEEEQEGADLSFPEALRKGQEVFLDGSPSFPETGLSAKDPAVIIFTSGTTGSSKGVLLTPREHRFQRHGYFSVHFDSGWSAAFGSAPASHLRMHGWFPAGTLSGVQRLSC